MSEKIAVLPYSHYLAVCDAVRKKTGIDDKIKSADLAGMVESCADTEIYLTQSEPPSGFIGMLEGRNISKIYVAYEYMEAYLSDENYSSYADRIKPMPTFDFACVIHSDGDGYELSEIDSGSSDVLIIPDTYRTLPIISLGGAAIHCSSAGVIIFPERLRYICSCAVNACSYVKEITIPESVKRIEEKAFNDSFYIEKVTFSGVPERISASAFRSNTIQLSNLKNIYVPWAYGEVSGAPWGASNATIHYDCKDGENED